MHISFMIKKKKKFKCGNDIAEIGIHTGWLVDGSKLTHVRKKLNDVLGESASENTDKKCACIISNLIEFGKIHLWTIHKFKNLAPIINK